VKSFKKPDEIDEGFLGETTEIIGKIKSGVGQQSYLDESVIARRGAYTDVSSTSPKPLKYGQETLVVNSSIMTLRYKLSQAGWLVDLELPTIKDASA
jgi:hypothetical protein